MTDVQWHTEGMSLSWPKRPVVHTPRDDEAGDQTSAPRSVGGRSATGLSGLGSCLVGSLHGGDV